MSIQQATTKYAGLAASLQALRVLMSHGKVVLNPAHFFREFVSWKTAGGVSSIGGYVFLYKVASCLVWPFFCPIRFKCKVTWRMWICAGGALCNGPVYWFWWIWTQCTSRSDSRNYVLASAKYNNLNISHHCKHPSKFNNWPCNKDVDCLLTLIFLVEAF